MSDNRPIALFIPTLNGGGAQRVIVNLANALVDLTDHPVHLVLVRAEGVFLKDVRPEVYIRDLNKKRTLSAIPALARYLRSERPVVLMARMNYVNIVATISWLFAGKPSRLVVSEATVVRPLSGSLPRRMWSWLLRKAMKFTYRQADCVVANSIATAKTLCSYGIMDYDSIVTIYNPVLDEKLKKQIDTPFLFSGYRHNQNLICAIGSLHPKKGFDCLLNAVAKLHNKNVDLVILGEGPLRAQLVAQARDLGIRERVHLPGFVLNSMHVLKKSNLFVLSSRWEGFGNVLVEALAVGIPIVSTDCPGAPRELLCDGKLGHLVPVDDPKAMAKAITEALYFPKGTPQARRKRALDFKAPVIAKQYLRQAFALKLQDTDLKLVKRVEW